MPLPLSMRSRDAVPIVGAFPAEFGLSSSDTALENNACGIHRYYCAFSTE